MPKNNCPAVSGSCPAVSSSSPSGCRSSLGAGGRVLAHLVVQHQDVLCVHKGQPKRQVRRVVSKTGCQPVAGQDTCTGQGAWFAKCSSRGSMLVSSAQNKCCGAIQLNTHPASGRCDQLQLMHQHNKVRLLQAAESLQHPPGLRSVWTSCSSCMNATLSSSCRANAWACMGQMAAYMHRLAGGRVAREEGGWQSRSLTASSKNPSNEGQEHTMASGKGAVGVPTYKSNKTACSTVQS